MDFDATGNNLEDMLSSSPGVRDWLHELAELGADDWSIRSRWRSGFNATHVEASTDHSAGGDYESTIYASGHYARWREHGTRYNAPERVMSDYLRSIDPDADINNP
ncbi:MULTISPECIES: hypothetical protein [Rhodococcus]|uniref:hypothetical protein n=1 Tax=Rhodococcus TaxID=1827 RepID=UPI00193B1784|nr:MULTISPECIES: hypothetical protein [Rhodococcus]QRI76263.1 hypothetical protein JQ505_00060 [Rhodococcus aetherivorans]QSE59674.1 hypothetical protein JYA75_01175 [Rhodococcus sp. PSBB066]